MSVDAAGRVNLLRLGHAEITVSGNGKTATSSIEVEGFSKLSRTSAQSPCAFQALRAPTPIAMGAIPSGTKIASISSGEPPVEIDRGEVPAGVKFTAVGVGPDCACAAGENPLL